MHCRINETSKKGQLMRIALAVCAAAVSIGAMAHDSMSTGPPSDATLVVHNDYAVVTWNKVDGIAPLPQFITSIPVNDTVIECFNRIIGSGYATQERMATVEASSALYCGHAPNISTGFSPGVAQREGGGSQQGVCIV